MDCKFVEARICDFLDGTLSDPEFYGMDAHLTACAACRRRVKQTQTLMARLGALSPAVAPPYLKNLVMSQVERRYRRPFGSKLRSFYEDLIHPLRMLERRDVVIALVSAPIALFCFLAIFFHMQVSIRNAEQVAMLTFAPSDSLVVTRSDEDGAKSDGTLTPVGISSPSLTSFAQSASTTRTLGDSFSVMVHVNQEGEGHIEQVIERPHDLTFVQKFISSVKFRPATLKGKRVDSYFILAFNQVHVLG